MGRAKFLKYTIRINKTFAFLLGIVSKPHGVTFEGINKQAWQIKSVLEGKIDVSSFRSLGSLFSLVSTWQFSVGKANGSLETILVLFERVPIWR